MNHPDFTATQMMWRPRLMRLTQIVQPELDGGQPTTCYVNPDLISRINRTVISWGKRDGTGQWPDQSCTIVSLHGSEHVMVSETPEEIAKARDESYGYKESKGELRSV